MPDRSVPQTQGPEPGVVTPEERESRIARAETPEEHASRAVDGRQVSESGSMPELPAAALAQLQDDRTGETEEGDRETSDDMDQNKKEVSGPKRKFAKHKVSKSIIHRTEGGRIVRTNSIHLAPVVAIFLQWADRLEKNLRVMCTDGKDPEDYYNRTFRPEGLRDDTVYIWLCGSGDESVKTKGRLAMSEIPLRAMSKAIIPDTAPRWTRVEDDRKKLLAHITKNVIHMPFHVDDVSRKETKDVLPVFLESILEKAEIKWKVFRREFAGILTTRLYGDFCGDAVKKRRAELTKKREGVERKLRDVEREVVKYAREVNDIRREWEMVNPDEIGGENQRQYIYLTRLIESGLYQEFRIKLDRLLGLTTPIVIEHKGVEYKMGQYVVLVDKDGNIEIEHLERMNPPHPHINKGGSQPCWGNISTDIPKLVGMERYGVLFQIIHDFLCSYNEASPYTKIEMFKDGVAQEMVREQEEQIAAREEGRDPEQTTENQDVEEESDAQDTNQAAVSERRGGVVPDVANNGPS